MKIGRGNKQLLEYTVNVKLQGPQLTSGLYPAIQYCDFSVLSLEPSHVLFYPQTISSTSYSLHSQCNGLQNKVFVPLGVRKNFSRSTKGYGQCCGNQVPHSKLSYRYCSFHKNPSPVFSHFPGEDIFLIHSSCIFQGCIAWQYQIENSKY